MATFMMRLTAVLACLALGLVEASAHAVPDDAPVIVTTSPLASGAVARPYVIAFVASGGTPAYSWSLVSGELPAGLTLTAGGVLDGKPEIAGTYGFRLRVTGSDAAFSERDFTLTIDPFRRYFAEGASSGFFDCYFALVNPGATSAGTLTIPVCAGVMHQQVLSARIVPVQV